MRKKNKKTIIDETLSINGESLPVVESAVHLGIIRGKSQEDTMKLTVNENIKKKHKEKNTKKLGGPYIVSSLPVSMVKMDWTQLRVFISSKHMYYPC